jgi:putative hemolysin
MEFSLLIIVVLGTLTVLSFVLSLSETSIISISKIKLHHMVAKGVRNARSVENLLAQSDKFIIGILVGNTVVNIAFSAIVTELFVQRFGHRWGIIISTFCGSFFILSFCEILPKLLALKKTERMALFIAPAMEVYIQLVYPVSRVFMRVGDLFMRIFGMEHPKRSPLITEEELRVMIEVGKEEGVLTDEERGMLHRIFEFGDTRIEDVMVPREKIVAIDVSSTPEQLLNKFVEEGHARLPVYKGSVESIIGVIYARDLLYILRDKGLFALPDLVNKVPVVAPETRINEVLRRFQAEKIQIAVVADAEGRTLGLVTLEDLIEEIVGEIEEKYSRAKSAPDAPKI